MYGKKYGDHFVGHAHRNIEISHDIFYVLAMCLMFLMHFKNRHTKNNDAHNIVIKNFHAFLIFY
jgi:hypothetical protein